MLATNELAHLVQGASQFVHFTAQLVQFVVPVVTLFLVVTSAMVAAVVVAVGASFDFLGAVMHAGGMQMLDRYHQVLYAMVRLAIAFVSSSFAMFALPLTMEMRHFLLEFTLRLLGFLVLVVLV